MKLNHWIYDALDVSQMSLFLSHAPAVVTLVRRMPSLFAEYRVLGTI
jgi:hypothetical protein